MLGAEFEIAREKMRAGFGPFTFILSLTGLCTFNPFLHKKSARCTKRTG